MLRTNRYTQARIVELLAEAGYTGPREGIFRIEIDPNSALIYYYPDASSDKSRQKQSVTWRLDLRAH